MKLVAFDLDDTLAPSKSPLPARMDEALRSLLDHVEVCIISGGQMGQTTPHEQDRQDHQSDGGSGHLAPPSIEAVSSASSARI